MNTKSWAGMTLLERNAALAALLGWNGLSTPEYCDDYKAVESMENEIARRNLSKFYVETLAQILGIAPRDFHDHGAGCLWMVLRSTPEQRAEAAYRVLSAVRG